MVLKRHLRTGKILKIFKNNTQKNELKMNNKEEKIQECFEIMICKIDKKEEDFCCGEDSSSRGNVR